MNLIDILENGKSVRIHPLLREFIFEKVSQEGDELNKLKSNSIVNIKNRYYDDFGYLVNEYANEREGNIDSYEETLEPYLNGQERKKVRRI